MTAEAVVAEIEAMFTGPGATSYLGEELSIREHMLQTAELAAQDGRPAALVVAALLHDIGYLVPGGQWSLSDEAGANAHEARGAAYLASRFVSSVVEPVRLHVEAKRALSATEAGYEGALSDASRRSLALQGGPMNEAEVASFAGGAHATDALMLRCYDDAAKVPGRAVPGLTHYLDALRDCLATRP